jgi:hypothetical protein
MTTYAETVYDETIRDYTPEHSDAEAEPPEANQHEPDVVSDVEPDLARQDQQMYDDASQIGLRSAMKHNLGERSDHGRSVAVLPTSISITGPRQAVDTASTLKEGIGAFMKQMKEDKIWQHHPRLTTLRPQSVSSGAHGFSSSRESYQQQHPIATVSRQRSGSEPASEDDDNGGDYDVDEYGRKVNKNKNGLLNELDSLRPWRDRIANGPERSMLNNKLSAPQQLVRRCSAPCPGEITDIKFSQDNGMRVAFSAQTFRKRTSCRWRELMSSSTKSLVVCTG